MAGMAAWAAMGAMRFTCVPFITLLGFKQLSLIHI